MQSNREFHVKHAVETFGIRTSQWFPFVHSVHSFVPIVRMFDHSFVPFVRSFVRPFVRYVSFVQFRSFRSLRSFCSFVPGHVPGNVPGNVPGLRPKKNKAGMKKRLYLCGRCFF